jgi:NAD+ diphosphatase
VFPNATLCASDASCYSPFVDTSLFDSFVIRNADPSAAAATGFWFVIRAGELLVGADPGALRIPVAAAAPELGLPVGRPSFIGSAAEAPCWAVAADPQAAAPAGWTFAAVRSLFGLIPDALFGAIARALETVEWERTHRFCGACGAPTRPKDDERSMQCAACGRTAFPRISPAAIVAVTRGPEILLARSTRFQSNMRSVLAGFVEQGETLEQCVRREVREEVGVEVRDVRYVGSQPWPFPDSLMVGFTAEWASGEIHPDPSEIADAAWYSVDALPELPLPISIARRLIDAHVARVKAGRAAEGRPAMHAGKDCAAEGRPAMHAGKDCAAEGRP